MRYADKPQDITQVPVIVHMKQRQYSEGFTVMAMLIAFIGIAFLAAAGLFVAYRAYTNNTLPSASENAVQPISKTLDLSNRNLTAVPISIFNQTGLETLNLSHNGLTGALPAEIRHLSSLRTLNASYNRMTGVPAEIGQLQNLEYLDLSYNQLTGLPQELGNLQHLRVLNLAGNLGVSSQDLAYIRAHLPQTTQIILN